MKYYIVDAFTHEKFRGNPAGVCVVEAPLNSEVMQKIAAENNLSETAFLIKQQGNYQLRWFTPEFEIDLCGHATLAAAHVFFHYLSNGMNHIEFETKSGILQVNRNEKLYDLYFPSRPMKEIRLTQQQMTEIGCSPLAVYEARDLFLLLKDENEVIHYRPNYALLQNLSDWLGVVIMSKGDTVDFVSRYFCPELQEEDYVTGSSHCSLIPYWAEKLKKEKLVAEQLSHRGGKLYCEMMNEKVKISGEAVLYMHGEIEI